VTFRVEAANAQALQGWTVTVDELNATLGLAGPDGLTTAVRLTCPEKRFVELITTVEVDDLPGRRVRVLGLALTPIVGATFDFLHAVTGWISHPEKE
jgi:hypothetical protein